MGFDLKIVLDYIIVPLIAWIIYIDRKVVKHEAEKTTKEDLEKIYNKLDEIKDNINDNFVSSKSCDFRHNIKE